MHFSYYPKDINFPGGLFYIQNEHSLYYQPFCRVVGVVILCGAYTGLDTICETGEIVHISGLNSQNSWIKKKMSFPKAIRGRLCVHFDEPPVEGTGISYDRTWETFYDADQQCICIGDYQTNESDDCVEFANNVIAVLRGGDLIAIWAKIKEVETAKAIEG